MSDPVETYFTALRDIRASGAGVQEVSYYGALEQLLNGVGGKLKPKVRAFMQLRNRGAGNPDGGLFVASQFKHAHDAVPLEGQPPARGAIEVKSTSEDVSAVAASEQVARYVEHYGFVLVTSLRDFVLVGQGPGGKPRTMESCSLAQTENGFWGRVAQPRKYAEEAAEGLTEFLKRVMLHNAPIADPKHVAWFLASYARTARLRLEQKRDLPALDQLREQLEEALGLKFEGDKGDHFFRSTLVQTLFYGMFASWVLWTREQATTEAGAQGRFEWETASATLHVPMVSELFYQFTNPAKLGPLGLAEVLDWAEDVLNRVERDEFFARFQEEHAVQYFYEPFLEAFDPQLRKELGVWYTPDEVVKYMVARVDWALREELGVVDGLADESVYVLDPCCGTGAYLVEVLRKIDETLHAKGADALTRQDVKRAAMERVVGFEIMPAPFVVAHLQLGLLLSELGVPLSEHQGEHERAAIYLTNALTGWKTDAEETVAGKRHPKAHPAQLLFEFEEERDAATRVKQKAPILVVLGNPPYNSFAGTSPAEEEGLVEPYKAGLVSNWGVRKFNLDDLYVRFIRLAERSIAERSGTGVVCLISNFSYLAEGSFVVMRRRLLSQFDSVWIDNLNGDSRETGKLTPEGKPDPSIFSTEGNREGIRVGTSIALFVRRREHREAERVHYRALWGEGKRSQLECDAGGERATYLCVQPTPETRYSFRPREVAASYLRWPAVTDLFPFQRGGVQTSRDEFVVDVDREALAARVDAYYDPGLSDNEIMALSTAATTSSTLFDAAAVRRQLQSRGRPDEPLLRYYYRPFDYRWIYWDSRAGLLNRPRADYVANLAHGNLWFSAAQRNRKGVFYRPQVSSSLSDYHIVESHAGMFPLMIRQAGQESLLAAASDGWRPNLSEGASAFVRALGAMPEDLFFHTVAVLHSEDYATENIGALKQEWPRIPLPSMTKVLETSAATGRAVASLLDPDQSLHSISPAAQGLGSLANTASTPLNPAVDLAVTARWGIAGKGGICMPSTGKLKEREYSPEEREAIAKGAKALGMSAEQAISLLGERCFDVYLNDVAYWRCVPSNVWRYTIGGYQVIKKWLS
ncbi:MAG: N-6 DNA methylase, partial [Coriobacteriia bacterium]|nr:N-6 DNA methylase [Coriobacteriia bacterium]